MNLQPLLEAINDRNVVSGLTHNIYRYPARFSPLFARAAIETFTKPGDTILDPFMGGSTSLVEAIALGRHAIGTDINELSVFLARVKTSVLSKKAVDNLESWAEVIAPELSPRKPVQRHTHWKELGYQNNMPWRFRKIAEQAINHAIDLLDEEVLEAARCIVLKTMQWAVDCKKALPTAAAFREKIVDDARIVARGLHALRESVKTLGGKRGWAEAYLTATDEIDNVNCEALKKKRPKLIVTSPPYPGIHVLYHRWQVLGRRETAAPYWITASNDGNGGSYYTFCDRRRDDHDAKYFERLQRCFTAIRKVVADGCVVAQLVGFCRPDEQLPLYQAAMKAGGFEEFEKTTDQAFWRSVPNRKFYVWLRDSTKQTKELLLLHRAT